jgi:5-methyltetrahydrofolate--homocysteine methyltransferase
MKDIHQLIKERILVIDGAMGTMIQRYGLSDADYRGERFADFNRDIKGNNELLVFDPSLRSLEKSTGLI